MIKVEMNNRRQRENKDVVNKIIKFLEKNANKDDIQIYNNWGSAMGRSGRPDLEIIYNGQTWYFECKDPKGFPSNIQSHNIAKFNKIGVPAYIVDDVNIFINVHWVEMNKERKC